MSGPYQHNDIEFNVSITRRSNGEAVNGASISEATYGLFDLARSASILTKSMGAGIEVGGNGLLIHLSALETANLDGVYYHELRIVSDGKASTVISEPINFQSAEL